MKKFNSTLNLLLTPKLVSKKASAIALCLSLILTGCNTSNIKTGKTEETILNSSGFIPVLPYDEAGNRLPYLPAENPYLSNKGRINKGSVLLFMEAKSEIKKENYDSAKNKLKLITERDKTLSGPWVLLAEIAVEKEQFNQAEDLLLSAIKINPNHVGAYSLLALTQRKQGKFVQAQNTLVKSLQVWKDFPEGHLNLAILYDIYLNKPEFAQRHMEAYQFLTNYADAKVAKWLIELQQRTGLELVLNSQSNDQNNISQGAL